MARVFISYKGKADPDERLAAYFDKQLTAQAHDVFIMTKIKPGQTWPDVVDQGLAAADYLVVLISASSVSSEMVIEEVRRGARLRKEKNRPILIPVRLAKNVDMPYDIGAKLNRIQHLTWEKDGDETAIANALHDIFAGGKDQPAEDAPAAAKATALSADGAVTDTKGALVAPRPAFDPSWLKSLDAQGGVVGLDSPFYVARQDDQTCRQRVAEKGKTVLIQGERQVGKTSLIARLYQHALEQNIPAVFLDFQGMDDGSLATLDSLLRSLAEQMYSDLSLNNSPDAIWKTAIGTKQKMTKYLEEEVIGNRNGPVVLFMDEVDRLFNYPDYYNDFFGLVRFWHTRRAFSKRLAWLNLVLAYSTEDSMFIPNANQSPFNVGEKIRLRDFTQQEFDDLNYKHGGPVPAPDLPRVYGMLGGHPFLVRQALYLLASGQMSLAQVEGSAIHDDGPFESHLRSYLLRLEPDLRQAMKSVLLNGNCADDRAFYRLRSIGLIRGHDRLHVSPRCGLYQSYFGARL